MDICEALLAALDGSAVLFLGSGFSYGATTVRGDVKGVPELVSHLATITGLSTDDGLSYLTDSFVEQKGTDALLVLLREEFTAVSADLSQILLGRIPWKRVYTTNYDDVFEHAAKQSAIAYNSITLSDRPSAVPKSRQDSPLIIHINGYVGKLTRDSALTEIKLTDLSYHYDIATSPWLDLFRQDTESARAIFYVGYSHRDLDISRILVKNDSLQAKSFVFLGKTPSAVTLRHAARFGTTVSEDTAALADRVREAEQQYTPNQQYPLAYCIERFAPPKLIKSLQDADVFDLLMFGDLDQAFLWDSLHGGKQYAIQRTLSPNMVAHASTGSQIVVVHSMLGNGKTVSLELLKSILHDSGVHCFSVLKHGDSLEEEIDFALRADGQIAFFADDYGNWSDFLRTIAPQISRRIAIIVAARTLVHDIQIDLLENLFPEATITEFEIDKLDQAELSAISAFFDTYGIWGGKADLSETRKLTYLSNSEHNEWHAILLDFLSSDQIIKRLDELFRETKPGSVYYQPIVDLLILAAIQFKPSVNELVTLSGPIVLDLGFKKNPLVQQFVDFDRGETRLRSALAAKFILQRVANPNSIVASLTSLMQRLDSRRSISRSFAMLTTTLMRFATISSILPENQSGQASMQFYEKIKTLHACARWPLFWLQYAMAAIAANQLERAGKYFETAYALARKINWNSYQIDNHFARYLLLRAAASGDKNAALDDFREASKIIAREISENQRLHYPYRVAAEIGNVFTKYRDVFTTAQRHEIISFAKFLLSALERLPEFRKTQRYASDCYSAMQRIVASTS